jgi:hypothetical protein
MNSWTVLSHENIIFAIYKNWVDISQSIVLLYLIIGLGTCTNSLN